jgi:hypothetical protein
MTWFEVFEPGCCTALIFTCVALLYCYFSIEQSLTVVSSIALDFKELMLNSVEKGNKNLNCTLIAEDINQVSFEACYNSGTFIGCKQVISYIKKL